MKTIFSLQTGIATLLCTAALAGLMACDADTVEQQGGKLPDKEPLENIYGRLRSSSMSDDKVRIRMTEGSGFVTSNFYYQFSKAPASELSLDAWIDGSLLDGWNEANDEQRTLLPEGNYDFPDGKTLSLSAENQRSALKRIRFMAENLAPGEYYLPLTVAEEAGTEEHQTINYLISIRARQLGEYKLNADQVFAVFYLDTEKYQPLLVDEYLMSKLDANTWENAWSEREDGLRTIGNIVNLNKVVLDYDAETGRALLNLGNDMRYVLDHIDKYIRPLQDKGRKVCHLSGRWRNRARILQSDRRPDCRFRSPGEDRYHGIRTRRCEFLGSQCRLRQGGNARHEHDLLSETHQSDAGSARQ